MEKEYPIDMSEAEYALDDDDGLDKILDIAGHGV